MDNLTLAQKLFSKKTVEEKTRSENPSSASVVYMIAVTASSNGEVVLRDEEDVSAEWEDGEYIEVDEDGDFVEFESHDDPLEDIEDGVIDLTDGDGADIEENDAVSYSVAEYQMGARKNYAISQEEEVDAEEDGVPGENEGVSDEIDDGDAMELPDDGESSEEDQLAEEEDEITEVEDDEYILLDDNSDDESDEPIEGAEISDGYTVAECIGTVKAGERVAVIVQNGKMTVLGVVGSGDEQDASNKEAHEKADEAAKTATNFISFDNDNGLQIGNQTDGSWKGFRAQITSSAFKILNSTEETLASYGAKLVELGKNATDAVIKFCGGKVMLSSKVCEDGRSVFALQSDAIGLHAEDAEYAATRIDNIVESGSYKSVNNIDMIAEKSSEGMKSIVTIKANVTAQEGAMGSSMHNQAVISMKSEMDGSSVEVEAQDEVNIKAPQGKIKISCKNAEVGLDYYDNPDSEMVAFLRPKNTSPNVALGSSSYKWYRLYQYHESVSVSDEREKYDILEIEKLPVLLESEGRHALEVLFDGLVPKIYQLNGEKTQKIHIGFIAQDISKVLKEIGISEEELGLINHEYWNDEETGEEKDEYGLAYGEFIALNTYMIQKLRKENIEMKERLAWIEEKLGI